jgi:murein DD-endopeptidase MepM/ murein hydrolase activator NlpD
VSARRGLPVAAVAVVFAVAVPVLGGPAAAEEPTPTPTPAAASSSTPTLTPTPTPTPTATPSPRPSPTPTPTPTPAPSPEPPGGEDRRRPPRALSHPEGAFGTGRLVELAAELKALGWPPRRALRAAFSPFIIGGPAAWTNSWGAPRFGPAPGEVRSHEGQDVYCRFGDPVLAAEPGIVEFDEGGLGGFVARLHREGGGYFYYAHLSRFNTKGLSSGDTVGPGDVIGFCGDSGNARGGAPHVHFGWYDADGTARDPMRHLVRWLRRARRGALDLLERDRGRRIERIDLLTTERLFGDAFAPDRSELGRPADEVWLAGLDPKRLPLGIGGLMESVTKAAVANDAPDRPRPFSAMIGRRAQRWSLSLRRAAAGHTGFSAPPG